MSQSKSTPSTKHVAPHMLAKPSRPRHSTKMLIKKLLLIVVVALLLFVVLRRPAEPSADFMKDVKTNQYQSVSLANGQIYFGKITRTDAKTVILTDVYYLKAQQSEDAANAQAQANSNQSFSLTKLGSEVFGPEDTLHIERNQMLFWDNLKNDSDVVKAIANDKK